jgi:hypothetical protein
MDRTTEPFPGAKENAMLLIGLPERPLDAPGHFQLTGKQAVTFAGTAPVQPVTLNPGDTLYRVFGGSAGMRGGFWAPTPPSTGATEGDWRASNAVEPVWNDGTSVASLTVKPGQAVQCWTGIIESQPARNDDGSVYPDWWLVGGGTQFFAQFWTEDFADAVELSDLGPTPWAGTARVGDTLAVSLVAAQGDLNTGDPVHEHVRMLATLAEALRATAAAMPGDDGAPFARAANTLLGSANTILENQGKDDATVKVAIRSDLGLGRHIEPDPSWPTAAQLDRAVTDVVHSAAVLSNRAG